MTPSKDRILGRLLAVEDLTHVAGASRTDASAGSGQSPSITKWIFDTRPTFDTIDDPTLPMQPSITKPWIDTNPITDYQEP
jgi:hypothetical protein